MALTLAGLLAAQTAAAHTLTYFGGPVMHSEQVVLVVWGTAVESTFTDPSTGDPGLIKYLASQDGSTTDIGGVLAQYSDNLGAAGTLENSANNVSYGGEYQIAPSKGGGSATASLTDADIQSQLQTSISAGDLPQPVDNGLDTLYVVLFPKNDTITMDGATSGVDFCAYHSTGGTAAHPLIYAVMPDNNGTGGASLFAPGSGCGVEKTTIGNQTSTLSHEFSEAVNDPETGLTPNVGSPMGWYENTNNGGEIADICDTAVVGEDTLYASTWYVQNIWSNVDGACLGTEGHYAAPTAGTISPPTTVVAGQAASFSTTGTSDPAANSASLSGKSLGPGIASYSWGWGDGTASSSGATPQHTYAQAGNYTVSLTVTDDLGFTSTATKGVSVSSPLPVVTTSSPATSIDDASATLPGTINPNGIDTTYDFIYGLAANALTQSTTAGDAGSGTGVQDVSAAISGLAPGTTYYYELVGTANSTVYDGGVQSFTTLPAPVVSTSTPATSIADTSATLPGTIDPNGTDTTYQFMYGTSPGTLDQLTTMTDGGAGTGVEDVSAMISGLTAGTTYYYELVGTAEGVQYLGGEQSFTTTGSPPPPPAPLASTSAASHVTRTGATLNGTVNADGLAVTHRFAWGTSATSLTHLTPSTSGPTGTSAVPVTAALAGLTPGTTYYFEAQATGGGKTVAGAVKTFRTIPPAPSVTIGAATATTATGATLHGTVNPHGTPARYYFQYGPTTAYGHSTRLTSAGSGRIAVAVAAVLASLKPRVKYHYRLVATGAGGTVHSADRTFITTAPAAAPLPRLSFVVPGRPAALGLIRVSFTCDRACSAGFAVTAQMSGPGARLIQPIALATGAARLRHAGRRATIRLRPTAAGIALGSRARGLRLAVTGAAWTRPGFTRRPTVRVLAPR